MSLTLYLHPLASYCQKVLVALYENGAPFKPHLVDLGDPESRAAFLKVWPIGKFPVLRDDARKQTVPESTIVIEYVEQFYPGATRLIPADADAAWQTRLQDRFYDLHVQEPMQKIVGDRLRAPGNKDPQGVEQARAALQTAYRIIEESMAAKTWAMGEAFTLADCAASPALFYANLVSPLEPAFPNTAAYLARLVSRPSFARVIEEAKPYFSMFPKQ